MQNANRRSRYYVLEWAVSAVPSLFFSGEKEGTADGGRIQKLKTFIRNYLLNALKRFALVFENFSAD